MAVLIVNTADDTVDTDDNKTSLREAVADAATMGKPVEIRFDTSVFYSESGTKALELTKTLTIEKNADIVIDGSLVYSGALSNLSIIGSDLHETMLEIEAGAKVVMRDLQMRGANGAIQPVVAADGEAGHDGVTGANGVSGENGNGSEPSNDNQAGTPGADGSDAPEDAEDGTLAVGAIVNRGTLTLERVDLRSFGAVGGNGGAGGEGGRGGQGGSGSDETEAHTGMDGADGGHSGDSAKGGNGGGAVAGIFNVGALLLRDTSFVGLSATGGDGGRGGDGVAGGLGGNYGHDTPWLPFDAAFAGDGGDGGDGGNGGAGGLAVGAIWNLGTVTFGSIQAGPAGSETEAGLGGVGGSFGRGGVGGIENYSTLSTGPNYGADGLDGSDGTDGDDGTASDFVGTAPELGNNFYVDSAATLYSDSSGTDGRIVWISLRQLGDTSGSASVDWTLTAGEGFDGADIAGGYDPNGELIEAGTLPLGGTVDMSGIGSKGFYLWLADDGRAEGIETFTVTLTDAVGGSLGYSRSIAFAITDSAVADTRFGNDEANRLSGSARNDTLDGGAGNDTLKGKAGNDVLIGGKGEDALYGGGGKDVFIFHADHSAASRQRADTIQDFKASRGDRIDLTHIDANSAIQGHQGFDFIGRDRFSRTEGELRYEKSGKNTYIQGDIDGDGKADLTIHLSADVTLKDAFFLL
jgi:Ca2+-binding RTX toxin-like protein